MGCFLSDLLPLTTALVRWMRFAFGNTGFASRRVVRALGRSSRATSDILGNAKEVGAGWRVACGHDGASPCSRTAYFWPNIGRLAIAFRKAGFAVDAVAPAKHPIHRNALAGSNIHLPAKLTTEFHSGGYLAASKPELIVPLVMIA